ncbi:lipopolysaccharide biosynthesis protein [Aureimonas endophytica]|uniref:Lipopolysaccharide biosynthesis protein n=1 Tax=Aureimonas endophytica TaxID=2027858 RepID=A0A916ZJN2_9HYPH|nr:oligosaccharide flippase family protein [Aureimonas endophytica]GGE01183.1 lipopolysaccharide biosynthesis protein [Aureimonas endophytica]
MSDSISLRRRAASALLWSSIQSWGGRVVSLLVFVLLARLLNPADFGLASSAFLIMTLLNLVAEFGCSDAIVQRRDLRPADVNLPFYVAMTISTTLATSMVIFAPQIASLMEVPGLTPYLRGAAMITPFMTFTSFQEFMYRRALMFRQLAVRTILGTIVGGIVGVGMAFAGFGTWSLICQFAAQTIVGAIWVWHAPVWKPSLELHPKSAMEIGAFGSRVVTKFVVDFATGKSVDFIILVVYGAAALGLFTVASRLYLLLLQLLSTSISSVVLSMLAKISDDLERVRRLYIRSTSICTSFGTPVFVGLAAIAPEVNHLMFGEKWAGADRVMIPLLLIGGIHCTQSINGAYLTAVGRPQTLLNVTIVKALVVLPPLYFIRFDSVAATADFYALCLLAITPIDFFVTLRGLKLDWKAVVRPLGIPFLACIAGFALSLAVRNEVSSLPDNTILRAIIMGSSFVLGYVLTYAIVGWNLAKDNLLFAQSLVKKDR